MDSAAGYTQQQLSKLAWLHTSRSVKAHLCYTHCLFDLILSHHLSLNREGHWGTTDDFIISFLHFSLFSTALWDLPNTRSVHALMLSSRLFLCLPCLLPPFTMPCKMDLARPDDTAASLFLPPCLSTWPVMAYFLGVHFNQRIHVSFFWNQTFQNVFFSLHLISHLSLNCGGCWGTTDDFTISFLHFSLFSTAL